MPKTELHVHLEGTVSPETLWDLAQRAGVALPAASAAALRATYVFDSFEPFLVLWLAMHASFVDATAYERMVDDYLAECRRQNVRYAEVHFTPYNHEVLGKVGGRAALAIVADRLRASEAAGGPVVRIICDISGEAVPASGEYTAALLEELAEPLIVGLGLGGPEVGLPRALFAPYFERARRAGYAVVAHAGETGPAEHVRQAVLDLKVRRVQHGIRAVDDASVVHLLAEREIACDVALTSNVLLTSSRELATHPIRQLLAAGVPVTLSTDDPGYFNTDLAGEYQLARTAVGLSLAELWQINLNGLRFGLADVSLRRRLMLEFAADGERLGLACSN
jgi:aminodeoxyfutalosine deaminase